MNRFLFLILIINILFIPLTGSQNLFSNKFDDCISDKFSIEKDHIEVFVKSDLANILVNNFDNHTVKTIKGTLSLQVLVNEKGESCLISFENKTNIQSDKLRLKQIIDTNLFWYIPKEKVSAIIVINFLGNKLQILRFGLSSEKGYHIINNN
jgi:hypothetical protein